MPIHVVLDDVDVIVSGSRAVHAVQRLGGSYYCTERASRWSRHENFGSQVSSLYRTVQAALKILSRDDENAFHEKLKMYVCTCTDSHTECGVF